MAVSERFDDFDCPASLSLERVPELVSGVAAIGEYMAQRVGIPAEAINALRILRMPRQLRVATQSSGRHYGYSSLNDWASLLPVADEPALLTDPLAADTLLLLAVPTHPDHNDRDAAIKLATRVADDSRLPDHFPLRQAALLWLANQSAQAGKLDEAETHFQRTGLHECNCSPGWQKGLALGIEI